jgi:hypothetical protein
MDVTLVTAWKALCQELAPAFSGPTWITFLHIATGWVLCRSAPTVTNLVRTVGDNLLGHIAKHWTTYEKFFFRASWSLDVVSRLLLTRVVVPLIDAHSGDGPGAPLTLAFDGTTCGRCGKHVAYAGYFKDASVSNTLKAVVHWAHNWVVGCIMLRCKRWPQWVVALPVLFALYRKPADCDRQCPFRTTQQLAAQMICQVHDALPDRPIRVVGDGQFATRQVAAAVPESGYLVSRIRRDAALNELPSPKPRRGPGRPPQIGRRLPTPQQFAKRAKEWKSVRVGKGGRIVNRLVWSRVCLWYHVCQNHLIKLVIVRDPSGGEKDDFLMCTDPKISEREVAEVYFARWPIEEAIQDAKQVSGFEKVQGWCARTVARQAPMAMIVQTLVKAWYIKRGVNATSDHPRGSQQCDWLPEKSHPSYLDMLATLRSVLWTHRINGNSTPERGVRRILKALRFTLCGAL